METIIASLFVAAYFLRQAYVLLRPHIEAELRACLSKVFTRWQKK